MVFWQDQSVARHRWGVDLGMVGGKIPSRLAVGGLFRYDFCLLEFFAGLAYTFWRCSRDERG